ncbi:MAG: aldo/keto reductase, partial [Chloroflexota bacterium]
LRGTLYRQRLTIIQPLIQTIRDIGRAYTADGVVKTPAQVAINWCICKGTMPIPGAKNAKQARQNIGAIGWRLSTEEIAALDNMSSKTITKLERLR